MIDAVAVDEVFCTDALSPKSDMQKPRATRGLGVM